MSADLSINGRAALLQNIGSSSDYGTHVRHDWEAQSFERYFEASRRIADAAKAADPDVSSVFESRSRIAELNARTDGSSAHAPTLDLFEWLSAPASSHLTAVATSAIISGYTPASASTTTVPTIRTEPLDASDFESLLPADDDGRVGDSFHVTRGLPAESSTPLASLTLWTGAEGVSVAVRTSDTQLTGDTEQLRHLIATELGWAGLALAGFKVNGIDVAKLKNSSSRGYEPTTASRAFEQALERI